MINAACRASCARRVQALSVVDSTAAFLPCELLDSLTLKNGSAPGSLSGEPAVESSGVLTIWSPVIIGSPRIARNLADLLRRITVSYLSFGKVMLSRMSSGENPKSCSCIWFLRVPGVVASAVAVGLDSAFGRCESLRIEERVTGDGASGEVECVVGD